MDKMLRKLEEMDPDERKRLKDLLKEKSKKGDDPEMPWMYKSSKPETEEYLLGRRVDKHVEDTPPTQEDKDAPGALFSEVIARRADLDMQAKMREDPLYAIRQKEEDARRKLLENPVKMKQLQKMIQDQKGEKSKKKKSKKDKKHHKKKKRHHSESEDSDSDSDDDIMAKYLAIVNKKKKGVKSNGDKHSHDKRHSHSRDSKEQKKAHKHHYESDSDPDHASRHRKKDHSSSKKRLKEQSRDTKSRQDFSNTDSDDEKHHRRHGKSHHNDKEKKYEKQKHESDSRRSKSGHGHKNGHRRAANESSNGSESDQSDGKKTGHRDVIKRHRHDSDSDEDVPKVKAPKSYGLIHLVEPPPKAQKDSRSRKRSRSKSPPPKSKSPVLPKKKLSDKEKARLREEMMGNAKWRDEQRESNVKQYKADATREKEALAKNSSASAEFLNPMLMKHASQSSVEDRIKRNKYNVQRTNLDQDKNFTKR